MKTAARLESYFEKIARVFSQQRDVRVVLTGAGCATDGNVIAIPANADYLRDADQRLLEGMIDHEWLHVREEARAKEATRAGLRYTSPMSVMKAQQGRMERELRSPKPDQNLILTIAKETMLLNAYEDIRIEAGGRADYPGVAENLSRLGSFMRKRNGQKIAAGETPDPWWEIGCAIIDRAQGADDSYLSPGARAVADMLTDLIERAKHQTSVDDALKLARETVERIKNLIPPPPQPMDQGDGGEEGDDQGAGTPGSGQGGKSKGGDEGDEDGDAGEGDGTDGDDQGDESGDGDGGEGSGEESSEPGTPGGGKPGKGRKPSSGDENKPGGGEGNEGGQQSQPNPERDDFARKLNEGLPETLDVKDEVRKQIEAAAALDAQGNRRYLPHPQAQAMDRVIRERVKDSDRDQRQKILNSVAKEVHGPATTLKQKILAVLRTRAAATWRGGKERGSVDASTLYSVRLGNRRVFAEREPGEKLGAAVAIVIDESDSMQSNNRTTYARAAALAMSECLSKVNGASFMVCGYDSECSGIRVEGPYTRFNRVRIRIYKDWEERYGKETRLKMMGITADGCTPEDEAVLFAARQLATRPEERKILITFCDGQPYEPSGWDSQQILGDHLREIVKRAGKAGIECIGAGIQTDAPRHYYPTWFQVDNLATFPAALMRVLSRLLVDRRDGRKPERRTT